MAEHREIAWALVQMLDGVAFHDLHDILALPEDECRRVWQARESARAALDAAPASAGGPSDDELDALEREHWKATGVVEQGQKEELFNYRDFARAVLARYGTAPSPAPFDVGKFISEQRPLDPEAAAVLTPEARWDLYRASTAPPPAEGEAAEIADHIRAELRGFHPRHRCLGELTVARLTRAADLLERQHPRLVPVAERPWDREGWCDAEGRCWFGTPSEPLDSADFTWRKCKPRERMHATVTLPHDALPLPEAAP